MQRRCITLIGRGGISEKLSVFSKRSTANPVAPPDGWRRR